MRLNPNSDVVLLVGGDCGTRRQVTAAITRDGYPLVEAATGEEALSAVRRQPPALVLASVRLPGMSGYELCHELRREFGESLAIMLLSGDRREPEDRVAALLLGADHYLIEPFDPYELLARMRRLLARSAADDKPALTRREHQVLLLLADGRSRLEIAHDLVISPKTVATHVRHILDKLGARSRAQAVALAFRANIIPGPNGDAL